MSKPDSMDTLINRAYASSRFAINSNDNNRNVNITWKYEWFTPLVQDDPIALQNAATSERNTTKKYPFRYKRWIPVQLNSKEKETNEQNPSQQELQSSSKNSDNTYRSNSSETLKPLDLSKFDTKLVQNMLNHKLGERVSGPDTGRSVEDDDSLTMEDIRGAVGNNDSIPGLSSSLSSTSAAQSKVKTSSVHTAGKKSETTTSEAEGTNGGEKNAETSNSSSGGISITETVSNVNVTDTNITEENSEMTDVTNTSNNSKTAVDNGDTEPVKNDTSPSSIPEVGESSELAKEVGESVIAEGHTTESEDVVKEASLPSNTSSNDTGVAGDISGGQSRSEEQTSNGSDKDHDHSQSQHENEEKDVEMED